jgi:hypothetical protein
MAKLLKKNGISHLGQAIQAQEHEKNNNIIKMIESVLSSISPTIINIARCAQVDAEDLLNNGELRYLQLDSSTRKDVNSITTKELQKCLKRSMNKI